jgi:hypothetical protein
VVALSAASGHALAAPQSDVRTTGDTASASTLLSSLMAASPSGAAMPVGDLPGWRQVFVDDFTTAVPLGSFPDAVAADWGQSYSDGWSDTTGNGTYMPSKVVSIGNGVMNIRLHTENGTHLVAAAVPTVPNADGSRGGLLYGRYAVRFRADSAAGYKTSFLLWPDSGVWPRDGEINFPEGNLDGSINGYLHPQGGTTSAASYSFSTGAKYPSWHTAVTEWSPGKIVYKLDGRIVGSVTSRVPNTPMHWVLQTETATFGGPPTDAAASNVQIDWVAVWAMSDAPAVLGPTSQISVLAARRTAARTARSLVPPRVDVLSARRRLKLMIHAPAPGSVAARLTARIGGRLRVLGGTRTRLSRTGARIVVVRLNRAAQARLHGRTRDGAAGGHLQGGPNREPLAGTGRLTGAGVRNLPGAGRLELRRVRGGPALDAVALGRSQQRVELLVGGVGVWASLDTPSVPRTSRSPSAATLASLRGISRAVATALRFTPRKR